MKEFNSISVDNLPDLGYDGTLKDTMRTYKPENPFQHYRGTFLKLAKILKNEGVDITYTSLRNLKYIAYLTKYLDYLIDEKAICIDEIISELRNPQHLRVFFEIKPHIDRTGNWNDFLISAERVLREIKSQKESNEGYAESRVREGGGTGEILFHALSKLVKEKDQARIKALLYHAGAAGNIMDSLIDIREDGRFSLENLSKCLFYQVSEVLKMAQCSEAKVTNFTFLSKQASLAVLKAISTKNQNKLT